ncbi:somatostatin receptor type 4-like, partial [Physella acuta]|uniref:somatostatin receptor type 4-like n=1 Tax=Physella acuta TaxID=109671 RepID=UPI0027DD153C
MQNLNSSYTEAPLVAVSDAFIKDIVFVFNCLIIPFVCVIGIVGNSLTIIILVYNGIKDTTNVILTALAVADLLFSITQLWCQLIDIVRRIDIIVFCYVNSFFVSYFFGWNQYAVCMSVQMAAVIAVERMIAVVFPFAASRLLTTFRIKCIVVGVYIFSGLMYVPRSFMFTVVWVFNKTFNKTIPELQYGDFLKYRLYEYNMYNTGIIATFAVIIPTGAILISTFSIIVKLTASHRSIKHMSAQSKRIKN